MKQDAIKKRYAALQPLPDTGWNFTWIDRLRTWKDFLESGSDVATSLRMNQASTTDYEGEICALSPALHDLLMEAFPLTPEMQEEIDERNFEFAFRE